MWQGSYCADEFVERCPPNSNSTVGSSVIGQCRCNGGFYPSLGASTDWCLPLPTGFVPLAPQLPFSLAAA